MTKTNRFTLIATILLGVLLYIIIRFAEDLNVAWDGSALDSLPVTAEPQISLPGIETMTDLQAVLVQHPAIKTVNSATLLAGYDEWRNARGFTGRNLLLGSAQSTAVDPIPPGEETELKRRSESGDAGASQALAANLVFDDLFGAIELFEKAAEQGSTFALLRIGSMLEALDATGFDATTDESEQRRYPGDFLEQGIEKLQLTALGYIVTAIRDGGAPIVDRPLLEWLDRLLDQTNANERVAVCAWSERKLLDIARARARRGKPAVTTEPPPVFFAIPDLQNRLPCNRTAFPIENLLDLTHCTIIPFIDADDEPMDLYVCPNA